MRKEGWTAKTVYDRSVIIKQLFKWGAKRKHIIENTLAGETVEEPQPTQQPCFTPEQVSVLLDTADPHESAIFTMMAYAGLRIGEVQQLRWSDLQLNADGTGSMTIRRGGSSGDKTKGKRFRVVPIHSELRIVLDKLPRQFDLIFTARPSRKHPQGGGMISERRLLLSLKRLCARCKFHNPNQYKLHTFRHAFASMMARTNTAYKHALTLMGHKNSRVFDMYHSMFNDDAQKAIATINYPRKEKPSAAA
jgi:integrase